ncbi:extradiol dioxygenase [Actinomycetes bacterium KLBMP 9759]
MITGVHTIIYSEKADEVRRFFRDVLERPSVDAGGGWLIFAMPPAELAIHPAGESRHELFLMCDDIDTTIADLTAKGVRCHAVTDERWGKLTAVELPDGTELGLYQPLHPLPPRGSGGA